MRRIKKRGAATAVVTRLAAYEKKSDDKEESVEEVVTITPEKVTLEEEVKPVPEDVKVDAEEAVKESEDVADPVRTSDEQPLAEETLGEKVNEPCAEGEEKAEEPVEEEEAELGDGEISEEKIVEDTVTITPEEVVFDETEKPVDESEQTDADEAVAEAELGDGEISEEKIVEDTVTITPEEVVFDETEKPVDESEQTDADEAVAEAEAVEESEEVEKVEEAEAAEEVPLEASEEESEEILSEEGSLDGDESEVEELAAESESDESGEETPDENEEETPDESGEEVVAAEAKPEKEVFKLTAPANQDEILANICVKRGRKLIYRPNEILFNCTAAVIGTDKDNEEGIKIKNILDEEIKQGVKLGYIDKYDGLKMSEIKEEYENDVVYEYAEQEFKRTGLVLEGDKIKVYIYDWDMKALHHVGFVDAANIEVLKPYLADREKYSFDICGLITGGKYRKVIKDEASGKVTVEKGNDGKLGLELDISIINRKD